jgi:hypothetical protein
MPSFGRFVESEAESFRSINYQASEDRIAATGQLRLDVGVCRVREIGEWGEGS